VPQEPDIQSNYTLSKHDILWTYLLAARGDDREPTDDERIVESMTFQVAMIASDGWILASDTRASDPGPVPTGDSQVEVPTTSTTSKIVYRPDTKIIYAFSGGELSRIAGIMLEDEAHTGINQSQRSDTLTRVSVTVNQKRPELRRGGRLIVIFSDPQPEMFTIDLGRIAVSRQDVAYSAVGSLAMFFVQRYRERRTVDDLKFLAAHTVLQGHFFNQSVVEGLELWWGKRGMVDQASGAEIDALRKRSEKLDARLRKDIYRV
jgi:hypothetical protein